MANKQIKDLTTEKTTPVVSDLLAIDDGSTGVTYKAQVQNILKAMNGLTEDTAPDTLLDFIMTYDTSASAPKKVKPTNLITASGELYPCNGRLTLTSGTPITTTDVTGATTIYFTPFKGNQIAVYNGSAWVYLSFSETSLALGTLTSGLPYDVFGYSNSGTLALEALAWSSGTARATALTTQNGVLVKSGATTRRYLGTFYTSSTTTTEDSATRRYLWNYYNRVPRFLNCGDTTNSWTYTTATWRAANNSTTEGTARFTMVIGVSEDLFEATNYSYASNSGGNVNLAVGVGIDSTSTNSALVYGGGANGATFGLTQMGYYRGYLAVGFHYISRLEISQATGTTTWYGDNGLTYQQTGMVGTVLA